MNVRRFVRHRWSLLAALSAGAMIVASSAQGQSVTGRGGVSGTVFDSISGKPIRGATVRFVGIDDPRQIHTTFSDSAGRYAFAAIPAGKYLAGFAHALLDSLGYDPAPAEVQLTGVAAVHAFATPSPASMIAAVCDPGARDGGLLVGFVRNSRDGAVLSGAGVLATWSEIDTTGIFPSVTQRVANAPATENGWFAVCGLPAERPVLTRGVTDADSTGMVRLTLGRGSVRIARYLVPARSTDAPGGSIQRRAQLRATIRDSAGRPVPQARATVWGTEGEAGANQAGALTLGSLPDGTQTLEVSAIGYDPVALPLELRADSVIAVNVVLPSRATVLSGVRVTATATSPRLAGFRERMQDAERGINFGYFITEEDIERRNPTLFSNLLEGFGGVEVRREGTDPSKVVIRGGIRHGALRCKMAVYLDNVRIIGGIGGNAEAIENADHINLMVDPTRVVGVEVYPYPVGVPPRYQSLNGMCGVVLIWTK